MLVVLLGIWPFYLIFYIRLITQLHTIIKSFSQLSVQYLITTVPFNEDE